MRKIVKGKMLRYEKHYLPVVVLKQKEVYVTPLLLSQVNFAVYRFIPKQDFLLKPFKYYSRARAQVQVPKTQF